MGEIGRGRERQHWRGGEESLMPNRRWWRRRASVAPLLGGCHLAVRDGRRLTGATMGVGRRRRRVRGNLFALALFVWEAEGWEPSLSLCRVAVEDGR